ncbi:hypothetical protein AAZX31_07G175200 [Glycine max]|nr:hypothetical protein JHK87_019046 [Glycine soja]
MSTITPLWFLLTTRTFLLSATSDSSPLENFLQCLSNHSSPSFNIKSHLHPKKSFIFIYIAQAHTHNHRFYAPTAPKPLAIVTALDESHVQGTVVCAKSNGIQIRIRSGGHDCEGLSYVSDVPFVVLDMFHFGSVDVDIENGTEWVEAGATIGEVYYHTAERSGVHAFPAGVCPTVGAGGHFLVVAMEISCVDNIIDARLVDVNGNILDRKSMGEDQFWAIRGGGGGSFGVILSWKIKFVFVTPKVTVFKVMRNLELEDGAKGLVYKWQLIATKLHEDLFIRVMHDVVDGTQNANKKTIQVTFIGLFLGQGDQMLSLVNESFPELGLEQSDCIEMPWINSTLYWFNYPVGTPIA